MPRHLDAGQLVRHALSLAPLAPARAHLVLLFWKPAAARTMRPDRVTAVHPADRGSPCPTRG